MALVGTLSNTCRTIVARRTFVFLSPRNRIEAANSALKLIVMAITPFAITFFSYIETYLLIYIASCV